MKTQMSGRTADRSEAGCSAWSAEKQTESTGWLSKNWLYSAHLPALCRSCVLRMSLLWKRSLAGGRLSYPRAGQSCSSSRVIHTIGSLTSHMHAVTQNIYIFKTREKLGDQRFNWTAAVIQWKTKEIWRTDLLSSDILSRMKPCVFLTCRQCTVDIIVVTDEVCGGKLLMSIQQWNEENFQPLNSGGTVRGCPIIIPLWREECTGTWYSHQQRNGRRQRERWRDETEKGWGEACFKHDSHYFRNWQMSE